MGLPDHIQKKPEGLFMREKIFPIEPLNGEFLGKDIVSVEQFTRRDEIETIFTLADRMRERVENRVGGNELRDSTVSLLFYQPSTRTFTSFYAAARWLGCERVMGIQEMSAFSSAAKGESLPDTIRTIVQTTASDVIVLRHPDDDSSEIAAKFSPVPIINGGSGRKEHPTQAILDLYTILNELGTLDNLSVTMIGDLRNGRTIKSLAKLLTLAGDNVRFNFIAPEVLQMPGDINDYLRRRGAEVQIGDNGVLDQVLTKTDVLYVTRIQSEWFTKQAMEDLSDQMGSLIDGVETQTLNTLAQQLGRTAYQRAVEGYVIGPERMKIAKSDMIVMHPLPRVGEIDSEFDDDPRAAYFRQMRYGLYTRMAELALVNGKADI